MRIGILLIFLVGSAFSQETYVSNENAASVGGFLGRYNTDNEWGITGSYSLRGFLQLSYTRSSILTDEKVSNFQDQYFLRFYVPPEKRFFFSVGAGYLYQKVSTELWRNFPLVVISEGLGFEGSLHLVTEDSKTRRVVLSLSYMYFEPNTELRTPEVRVIDATLARSLMADVAVVYYLGQIGLLVGPRIALDSDFKNLFIGLHSGFLIRH